MGSLFVGTKPAINQVCNTHSCIETGGTRSTSKRWRWESGGGKHGCYEYGGSSWVWPNGPSDDTHGSFKEGMVIDGWKYTTVPNSCVTTGAGGNLDSSYGCSGSIKTTCDLQREKV